MGSERASFEEEEKLVPPMQLSPTQVADPEQTDSVQKAGAPGGTPPVDPQLQQLLLAGLHRGDRNMLDRREQLIDDAKTDTEPHPQTYSQ